MFGWIGIIVFSYLLGVILKKLWIWILIHRDEPAAFPVYLLNVSFLFMVISRGYLPQQLQLYMFCILPIDLVYLINSRKLKGQNLN